MTDQRLTIEAHSIYMKIEEGRSGSDWKPEFRLDLDTASAQAFEKLLTAFYERSKALGDLKPLDYSNGWYKVTPQMCEDFLRRHRPGANREVSFATVRYYADLMRSHMWPKTGQPLIFTTDGVGADGQHREWAGYLGLVDFDSYVIVDVEPQEHLFAYMDNVKARTGSTALQTAGLNGLSSKINQTISIAVNFESGVYSCGGTRTGRLIRLAPIRVLQYVEQNPLIRRAVHLAAGEYHQSSEMIGSHADLIGFLAYKIIGEHGEEICDQFMEEIAFPEERDVDAMKALHVFLVKQQKTDKPVSKVQLLAHLIKAFNAWMTNTPMKRLVVPPDDPFPNFVSAADAKASASASEPEPEPVQGQFV